ncbi:Hsp20/alpha crystallin family protein [Desulfobacterota bacterium M19]
MNNLKKITGDKKVLVGLLIILLIISTIQGVFLIKMYRSAHQGLSNDGALLTFNKDFSPKDNFFNPFKQQNWNPVTEFQNMRRQMNRMLDNSYNRFRLSPFWDNESDIFLPQTDILDKKDSYVIKMNIPGSDRTKIETEIKGGILTVKAKTEIYKKSSEGETYLRMERGTGIFERSISLPGPVKGGAMKTEYKNGVLTIILPKANN